MNGEHRGLDDVARLLMAAAGLAKGMEREVEDALRRRFEQWRGEESDSLREEREAVMEMARKALAENARLREEVAALRERVAKLEGGDGSASGKVLPARGDFASSEDGDSAA